MHYKNSDINSFFLKIKLENITKIKINVCQNYHFFLVYLFINVHFP